MECRVEHPLGAHRAIMQATPQPGRTPSGPRRLPTPLPFCLHDPRVNTIPENPTAALERRLPADYIRRRQAMEDGHTRRIFRPLHRFMHVDGPVSLHACVRLA